MSASDITRVTTVPGDGGPPSTSPAAAPRIVLGRYAMGALIGRGGVSQVHLATDIHTGTSVAVKLLAIRDAFARHQLRQELAALRGLRLPGVVRLLDDGVQGSQVAIVMERVGGVDLRSWLAERPTWEEAGPLFRSLALVLARLHHVGILHRDLKPANVRVLADGQPVLLDFGLARGARVAAPEARLSAGTRGYAPPEQWEDHDGDATSDRYALGRILLDWLEEGTAPEAVRRLAESLVDEDPARRPQAAADVLVALGGRATDLWGPGLDAPASDIDATLGLFGDGAFDFRRTELRMAQVLANEGAGESAGAVLCRWVREGRVYWDGRHYVSCDVVGLEAPRSDDLAATLAWLDEAVSSGRVEEALRALRRVGDRFESEPRHLDLLRLRAQVALELQDVLELELTLRAVEQAVVRHPAAKGLRRVLRGARLALDGEPDRAAVLLDEASPWEELEILRQGYRGFVARSQGREAHESFLSRVSDWASRSSRRQGALVGWTAQQAFRAGRWEDAAQAHERARTLRQSPVWRLAALLNASHAWLLVPDLQRAREHAEKALSEARVGRHPKFEARATWLLRAARYRTRESLEPRPELVRAGLALGPVLGGLLAIGEAAIAWRHGDSRCRALAEVAADAFSLRRHADGEVLAEALLRSTEGGVSSGDQQLAARAVDAAVPEVGLQALALLPRESTAPWRAEARRLADSRPRSSWGACLEVMSVDEALQRIG